LYLKFNSKTVYYWLANWKYVIREYIKGGLKLIM